SANDVAQVLAIAMRRMRLKDYHGGDQQLPVLLRFQGAHAQSVDHLSDFKVRRPDGTQIPLMSMISVATSNAASSVERENRQISLGIRANPADTATSEDARKAIEATMNGMQLPAGYSWSFGSNFSRDDDAGRTMGFNLLIALVLAYVAHAAFFECGTIT